MSADSGEPEGAVRYGEMISPELLKQRSRAIGLRFLSAWFAYGAGLRPEMEEDQRASDVRRCGRHAMEQSGLAEKPVLGVIFDVDGTLYRQTMLRAIMLVHMVLAVVNRPWCALRKIRVILHYRQVQEALRRTQIDKHLAPDAQECGATERTNEPLEMVRATTRYWMEELPLRFIPMCARHGLIRRIRKWHAMGVPMAVYSDYPAAGKLQSLGIGGLFRAVVWSSDPDVCAFKPNPRGFEVAAERLGLPASCTVYVGDRADVDGMGAGQAGMRAVIVGQQSNRKEKRLMMLDALDADLEAVYGSGRGKKCWVCGSSSTHRYRPSTIRQHVGPDAVRITDKAYGQTAALRRCSRCGFVFADPLPVTEMLDLYRSMEDPEYEASSSARRIQMRRLLDALFHYRPQAQTLLEVGAGTGLLVAEAIAAGLKAEGVEPSRWCVRVAAEKNGVRLHCGTLEECSGQLSHYDLVVLADVLEHVTEPLVLMRQATDRLVSNGRLVVVTPDVSAFLARLMGRWWWHHRIAHVGYLSPRSMQYALQLCGLEIVGSRRVGWRFPLSYVCRRLVQYLSFPPLSTVLNWLADSELLAGREVNLNLGDSRMFVARRKGSP